MPEVTMPKMGDAMEEGTLVEWLKAEGDAVQEQEPIAVIENEKSTLEIASFYTGRLSRLLVEPGKTVPVGTPIALIDTGDGAGEAAAAPAGEASGNPPARGGTAGPPSSRTFLTARARGDRRPEHQRGQCPAIAGGRAGESISLARRVAAERGVDLAQVRGTGPGGRIVEADVEEFLRGKKPVAPAPVREAEPAAASGADAATSRERAPAAAVVSAPPSAPGPSERAAPAAAATRTAATAAAPESAEPEVTERELSPMRRTIARRLVESKRDVPHYYVTSAIEMRAVADLREQINALRGDEPKLSYNDFIVRACALSLLRFPSVNSQFIDNRIRTHSTAHIGIAVALPEGLIVPVLRHADRKSLSQISAEARALAERARAGQLKPEEYSGGTFTISNLGMFDVEAFAGIINPPECALLAVGAITEEPVVRQGQVAVGLRMRVTLSADHRVIDGAVAAQFLQEVKRLLQEPLLLI